MGNVCQVQLQLNASLSDDVHLENNRVWGSGLTDRLIVGCSMRDPTVGMPSVVKKPRKQQRETQGSNPCRVRSSRGVRKCTFLSAGKSMDFKYAAAAKDEAKISS
jgi:hypothetical protein